MLVLVIDIVQPCVELSGVCDRLAGEAIVPHPAGKKPLAMSSSSFDYFWVSEILVMWSYMFAGRAAAAGTNE